MNTVSPAPGSWLGSQFAGSLQLPPLALFHLTVMPAAAVAVNVACTDGKPTTVAVAVCVPMPDPSVQVVCASPFTSVTTESAPNEPPSPVENSTDAPSMGMSLPSSPTMSGNGSWVPAGPVWLSPPLLDRNSGAG
jgi:hypothetical protein